MGSKNYLYGQSSGSMTPSLSIIEILKEYNKQLPQDFIGRLMGWDKKETAKQLKSLEESGLVRLDGDDVELVITKS